MLLQAGTHLHDRYRVLRRIGRGGMGAVYEAVDTRLRNTVAVKQLEIAGAAADRAFEREAQLLAGLRHPVLPVVIDYFSAAHDAFLVMQYIEGEDLEQHLGRQQRPCERDEVIAWANALLDGLEYLHSHSPSIIHRDIKPSNVKRTPAGEVVLLDFGLAKGRLETDETVARDNSLYGFTLQYAPLEQIDGLGTDVRSDLFALGAPVSPGDGRAAADGRAAVDGHQNGLPDPLVPAHVIHPPVSLVLSAALVRDGARSCRSIFVRGGMRSALSALAPTWAARQTPRRRRAAEPGRVGRQTDMIVQVSFAESPLLGIEDWPTTRRPDQIEQRSEPLQVTHLVDPATGRLAAARVRIKIASSDFVVDGDPERLIEVPVDAYSKRMAFLLTPRRTGFCRVNIEVYALDSLYLGTVAVEAEAVSAEVVEAVPAVAHIVLGSFARQAAAPKPAARVVSATAAVRIKITPELAAAIANALSRAHPTGGDAAATMVGRRADSTPTGAIGRRCVTAARDSARTRRAAARERARQRRASRRRASLASRLRSSGAAAAVLIAGLVFSVAGLPAVWSPPTETSFPPAQTTAPAAPAAAAPGTPPPPGTAAIVQLPVGKGARAASDTAHASCPTAGQRSACCDARACDGSSDDARARPPVGTNAGSASATGSRRGADTVRAPPPPAAPPPPPRRCQRPPHAATAGRRATVERRRLVCADVEAAKKLNSQRAGPSAGRIRTGASTSISMSRVSRRLAGGLVTARRVEAAEATLNDVTQSIARVRARLDAQTRRKK